MSSYQFVNSMSACYGQRGQDASGVNTDYYGASVNSYNNCYSPPLQQYGGYTPSGLSAVPNGSEFPGGGSAGVVVTSASAGGSSVGTPSGSGGNTTPGPSVQGRLHQTSTSPAATPQASSSASCKFAPTPESSTANPVGSPQDLSVSAGGNGPGSSSSGSGSEQNSSSQGGGGGSSNSGGGGEGAEGGESLEGASGSAGGSSSGKPAPQIYPWMKRVHLGQSLCMPQGIVPTVAAMCGPQTHASGGPEGSRKYLPPGRSPISRPRPTRPQLFEERNRKSERTGAHDPRDKYPGAINILSLQQQSRQPAWSRALALYSRRGLILANDCKDHKSPALRRRCWTPIVCRATYTGLPRSGGMWLALVVVVVADGCGGRWGASVAVVEVEGGGGGGGKALVMLREAVGSSAGFIIVGIACWKLVMIRKYDNPCSEMYIVIQFLT
nr:protein SPT2 homolog [Penaeus vannamei]